MTWGLSDLPTPLASLSLGTGQPVFTALALGALPAMGLAPQLSHGLQFILAPFLCTLRLACQVDLKTPTGKLLGITCN